MKVSTIELVYSVRRVTPWPVWQRAALAAGFFLLVFGVFCLGLYLGGAG